MTLDIAKYLTNLIEKEAKISHFSVNVNAGKTARLTQAVKDKITSQNGESFLQDADYIIFFTNGTGWTSNDVKTLFDVTNRALGKSANSMTQGDFKTIKDDKVPSDDADNADSSEEKKDVSEKLDRTMFLKITVK